MKIRIEYSIVSPGTEKYIKKGYMGISTTLNGKRKIYDCDHGIKEVDIDLRGMEFLDKYNIKNIAFSRFELISEFIWDRVNINNSDSILILGLGSVGIGSLINFLDKGKNKIDIYIRNSSDIEKNIICNINSKYKTNISIIDEINYNYNYFIDTTGASEVLKKVFLGCNPFSNIILLGTAREEKYNISPLLCHRKNLLILGVHEFNGVLNEKREEKYEKILNKNVNNEIIDEIVSIVKYNKYKGINRRVNLIEVYSYDI